MRPRPGSGPSPAKASTSREGPRPCSARYWSSTPAAPSACSRARRLPAGAGPAAGVDGGDAESRGRGLPRFVVHELDRLLDSSNMTPHDWNDIGRVIAAQYESYDGFVLLHGTDTMAYTASALSFMLEGLAKPVILTGSQIPMCETRNDARANLLTSLMVAGDAGPAGGLHLLRPCPAARQPHGQDPCRRPRCLRLARPAAAGRSRRRDRAAPQSASVSRRRSRFGCDPAAPSWSPSSGCFRA